MNYAINKEVKRLIYLSSAINYLTGYLMIYLTGFIPSTGIGVSSVGIVLGVQGALVALSSIPFGVLSDRYGRKKIIYFSIALVPLALVFLSFPIFVYLLLGSCFLALTESGFLSSWNAMIADNTDGEERVKALSLSFVLTSSISALGYLTPFFFPFFSSITKVEVSELHYIVLYIFTVVVIALYPLLYRNLSKLADVKHEEYHRRNWRFVAKVGSVNMVIGLGAGIIIPLVPSWLLLKFNVQDTYSGPILGIGSLTIGLASLVSPMISRRLGLVRAISLTMFSSVFFMISLAFISDVYIAVLIYLIRSALMNMSNPLLDTFVMNEVSPEERGFVSAAIGLIWRIPNAVSTPVGGYLLQNNDFVSPWVYSSLLYILGTALFYYQFRKIKS